jgi:SAM-dependent methyltransferase
LGQTSALDSAALGTLCPVCEGAELRRVADAPGWGSWLACAVCSHEFVDPLEVDGAPTTLFGKAYKGTESRSAMDDFAKRVSQRDALISDPKLWFWSPAFDEILAWLHEVTPGGVVLEIGCGLGFFLHALRREGFDARGLDVADLPVELNRRDGFEVFPKTGARRMQSSPSSCSITWPTQSAFLLTSVAGGRPRGLPLLSTALQCMGAESGLHLHGHFIAGTEPVWGLPSSGPAIARWFPTFHRPGWKRRYFGRCAASSDFFYRCRLSTEWGNGSLGGHYPASRDLSARRIRSSRLLPSRGRPQDRETPPPCGQEPCSGLRRYWSGPPASAAAVPFASAGAVWHANPVHTSFR